MASYTEGTPASFSSTWISRTINRWNRDQGYKNVLTRMSRTIFPRMPVSVWIGFTSRAEQNTDTGLFSPALAPPNPLFHELGWFGVEAGPTFTGTTAQVNACKSAAGSASRWAAAARGCHAGPAPAINNSSRMNNWFTLSTHADVKRLLGGRNAYVIPGNWAGRLENSGASQADREASMADQLALGLINQLRHGRNVNAGLPHSMQAQDQNSSWFAFLSFCGWSAGDGLASARLSRFSSQCSAASEDRRLAALVQATVGSIARATLPLGASARTYNNVNYLVIRGLQKWQLAMDVAARIGEPTSYFDLTPHNDTHSMDLLARAAYGVQISAAAGISPAGQTSDEDVGPITGEREDVSSYQIEQESKTLSWANLLKLPRNPWFWAVTGIMAAAAGAGYGVYHETDESDEGTGSSPKPASAR